MFKLTLWGFKYCQSWLNNDANLLQASTKTWPNSIASIIVNRWHIEPFEVYSLNLVALRQLEALHLAKLYSQCLELLNLSYRIPANNAGWSVHELTIFSRNELERVVPDQKCNWRANDNCIEANFNAFGKKIFYVLLD